jgi:putative copper export protein
MDVFWRWLHLVAASFWLGGLIMLAIVTMSARSLLDRPTFRTLIGRLGRAFLAGSVIAWALLGLSGLGLAASRLHSVRDLPSTGFGRTLTAKTALFLLAIAATVAHSIAGGRTSAVAVRLSRGLTPLILLVTLAIFYLAARLAG